MADFRMTAREVDRISRCGWDDHWIKTRDGNRWFAWHVMFGHPGEIRVTDRSGQTTSIRTADIVSVTREEPK